MNFNSKTMLCFVMFINMVFAMYYDQDHWLSKEEIQNLKLKIYVSEEHYQQKLKIIQNEDVVKLTWENNFKEMKADYENLNIKYDMNPIDQYVIYKITTNSHKIYRRHGTYLIFIHVQTQVARIFYANEWNDPRIPLVFGDTQYPVDSLVNFPLVWHMVCPTYAAYDHWIVSYVKKDRESTSPVKRDDIFDFDTHYENNKFYVTKGDRESLRYVITLGELIPEILHPKFFQNTRFYLNRGYKYKLESFVKTKTQSKK